MQWNHRARQRLTQLLLSIIALFLASCAGAGGDVQLTLVSQNVELSTQIADLRSTATYEADRLQITIEYIETAIPAATLQNQVLSLTLQASGINPLNVTPGAPIPTQLPAVQNPTNTTAQALVTPGAGTTVDAELITPASQTTPQLYNIVLAEGVGSNDCALASQFSFSSATSQIYVVATAANIPSGTLLASRWFNEGTQVVLHDFAPDFNIEQNCIWFYIDQADTVFTPGNWSVQLEINGSPAGSPVPFTITE